MSNYTDKRYLTAWIARNDDGKLHLFTEKPTREWSEALSTHYWTPAIATEIGKDMYKGLKPEDPPIEVEITMTPKMTPAMFIAKEMLETMVYDGDIYVYHDTFKECTFLLSRILEPAIEINGNLFDDEEFIQKFTIGEDKEIEAIVNEHPELRPANDFLNKFFETEGKMIYEDEEPKESNIKGVTINGTNLSIY